MHVRGDNHDRVDQAGDLVHVRMDLYPEIPLVAFLGLVHLGIALPISVFGEARCSDQGGVHDHALVHRHAFLTEVGFKGFKNLLTELVLSQQVAEGEDRGLIRDPIADQLDAGKPAHRGHLDQGLSHGRIAEGMLLA